MKHFFSLLSGQTVKVFVVFVVLTGLGITAAAVIRESSPEAGYALAHVVEITGVAQVAEAGLGERIRDIGRSIERAINNVGRSIRDAINRISGGGSNKNSSSQCGKFGCYPNGNYPPEVPIDYRVSVDGLLGKETLAKIKAYPELAAQYNLDESSNRCTGDGGTSNCGASDQNVKEFQEAFNKRIQQEYDDYRGNSRSTCTQVTSYKNTSTGSCVGSWSAWQPYSAEEEKRAKYGSRTTAVSTWDSTYTRNSSNCTKETTNDPIPPGATGVEYTTTVEGCREIEFRDLVFIPIIGCMDPQASNYNRAANTHRVNDCEYTTSVAGVPYIVLNEPRFVGQAQGFAYTDPGYTAYDREDGDITNEVVVDGNVDVNTVGVYVLHYNVSDGAGNQAVEQERKVSVGAFNVACQRGQIYNSTTDSCVFTSCPDGQNLVDGSCRATVVSDGLSGTATVLCSLDQDWGEDDTDCTREFVLSRTTQPVYLRADYDLPTGCGVSELTWKVDTVGNTDPETEIDADYTNTEVSLLQIADVGTPQTKFHTRRVHLNTLATNGCLIPPVYVDINLKLLDIDFEEK